MTSESERIAVFGYGSLASPVSASQTIGRRIDNVIPANLGGWRRRFSQGRDNLTCEKTFELAGGHRPAWIMGLNIEPGEDPAGPVNGALIELSPAELDRLDLREIRYDRCDVTGQIETAEPHGFDRVITYRAKSSHLMTQLPRDAVILETYAAAVEQAFSALGPDQLNHYLVSTGPYPCERVPATLVADRIPEGNPRTW